VLAPFGIAADRAFALSLVWLASNLIGASVGLVLTLTKPEERAEADETTTTGSPPR